MCLNENTLELVNKVLFIASIVIPIIYLIQQLLFKKRKKKIGFYLVAILIFVALTFVRGEILKIKICKDDNNRNNEKTTTTKTIPVSKSENYVGKTSKGYIIEKINDAYYIDDYLIANKTYALGKNFVPKDTYKKIDDEICVLCIDNTAYSNWLIMKNDASAIGLEIYIASGYRSFEYQKGLYDKYVNNDGKEAADTYSARAGHSEHQTGLSFDLNSINSSFAATNEGRWVNENAHLYGFIIRYPKGKEHITGYKYEPWHLRYVGVNLAEKLYNKGEWITMEEYFGINSKYE